MATIEKACADTERAAENAVQAATALTGVAKQLLKAAQAGDIGKIRRLEQRLGEAAQLAKKAKPSSNLPLLG